MWGMTVDLDACVGCGACVAACYAENNVPVVGESNVQSGREMSWIRIEKYVEANHEVRFLPNLCQHCHNAPCEPVCPVHAAYHTYEGLNGQVYNRCVGTRYCSNNCVYKVRRFNWFDYHRVPEPMNLLFNPDVTVRELGVMEKCTMCVQRIRKGREDARRAHPEDPNARPEDGAIVPACAQACPARVFTFGNMADPSHRMNEVRRGPRGYHLLGDLGTRPSVTYLKKVLRGGEIIGAVSVHDDEAHPSHEAAEHLPGHETEPSAP
jgi:molybdopterin-containing oxidoreductase family iron-sulfur binding subunit